MMDRATLLPGEASLENNLPCPLCGRPFAPDPGARSVWRREPHQAIPLGCPHCRATNVYHFENLISPPLRSLRRSRSTA